MKARSRKNRGDTMGWRRRASVTANAASSATPAASRPTISGEPQPRWLLSISPRVTAPSPRLPSSRPGRSRRPGRRVAGLGHHPPGDHEGGHPDGQVHVEHPAPAEAVGEQPADHRAGGQGHRRHPRPQADGLDPLARVGEGRGQDGQGAGQQGGRPHRLEDPPADQRRQGRGEAAQGRGGGEHHQAGPEHPPAAEPVPQRAGGQQQAGEHQDVGVQDQGQPRQPGLQLPLDAGQGHVHDRVVQHHHEQPEAAGAEGEQPVLAVDAVDAGHAAHCPASRRPARDRAVGRGC